MVKRLCPTKFSQMRESKGFTITDVAKILGKSERTVYRWENGTAQPSESVLRELGISYLTFPSQIG
ncbi:MAG: hypothetical protein FD169_2297 [Bacillota bacterium]|nr:MAG: hypothetical protein FD169_2297 [Bacillota bacterium]MBS3950940.1 helix-turn-helix transcriptional regulator [Peptococcaceae bacterium]